jgi:hypothetical protein
MKFNDFTDQFGEYNWYRDFRINWIFCITENGRRPTSIKKQYLRAEFLHKKKGNVRSPFLYH